MNAKATIAASGSLSNAINVDGKRICGIQTPSAWTAADLTFQASFDGVTYNDVYDEAEAEVTVQGAASRYTSLDAVALELSGVPWVKIRSGPTALPVAQSAERVIIVVMV
jgi:hypothetical protein